MRRDVGFREIVAYAVCCCDWWMTPLAISDLPPNPSLQRTTPGRSPGCGR